MNFKLFFELTLSNRYKELGIFNNRKLRDYIVSTKLSSFNFKTMNFEASDYLVQEIYQMMKVTDDIFRKHKIDYVVNFGTLLGSVRHGGFIPWDDDIDIEIQEKDLDKLFTREITEDFHKNGYIVLSVRRNEDNWLLPRVMKLNNIKSNNLDSLAHEQHNLPMIDIFLTHKKNNKFEFTDKTPQSGWPNCNFEVKTFYPIKRCKFGPIEVNCSANAVGYLDKCYPNWSNKAEKYNHYYMDFLNKFIALKNKKETFYPALPKKPLQETIF